MKLRNTYEIVTAVIALSLWVIIVTVEIVKGGRWAWSLPSILLSTPMAIVTTILLCRFRVARKKPVSYGTLFAGPFGSALLVLACSLFYYDGWRIFTSSYWLHMKGGWEGMVFWFLALVGGVCVLPAVAIVLYYQRQSRTDEAPVADQHREEIPEWLVRSWRWAIELFCSSLLFWYWILRFGTHATEDQMMGLIDFGSCIMLLLLITSLPSLRFHWRHGLFGLVVFFAWFVSLFCFPPLR